MHHKAASISQLRQRAHRRLPKFVYEYLAGGCITDRSLLRNREDLDAIALQPTYLQPSAPTSLACSLLGRQYSAPIGIAPIGLSGLIWPHSAEYLATCAKQQNIPFVLSTVATTSIERAASLAEDNFWFQLYPPPDDTIRTDLIKRAIDVGCQHLVVTIDVPSLGRRPLDIVNGLSLPPKLKLATLMQAALHPQWACSQLIHRQLTFANLAPYLSEAKSIKNLGLYVRSVLKDVVDKNLLAKVRDEWPHKLIVKGILTAADAQLAIEADADALIVSNHGGRQLDCATSTISVLQEISASVNGRVPLLADSGVESGVDVARFLSHGAQMAMSGRAFMYGVAAFGEAGANHVFDILRCELQQTLEQLRCADSSEVRLHLDK